MDTGYPFFSVIIITLILYFTSLTFSKWNIIPVNVHRKIWNIVLLISFMITGIFGIICVIKINTKTDFPTDQLLYYHVVLGIVMVVVGFIHFFYHLSYYFSKSKVKVDSIPFSIDKIKTDIKEPQKLIYGLFLLGFLSMISQVVFIREFLNVLAGNELIIGMVLSVWMLITGWGAYTGRSYNIQSFSFLRSVVMLVILSFLPLFMICLLYIFRYSMFSPGILIGVLMSLFIVVLFLFPVCFLSGYLFTIFSSLFCRLSGKNYLGKAYAFESTGSLIGGLFFGFVLSYFFNSFQIFALTSAATCFTIVWLFDSSQINKKILFLSGGIAVLFIVFFFHPEKYLKKYIYPNQQIVMDKGTRYENITVTKQSGQFNFYGNNSLLFYTENKSWAEEAVHYAMIQHSHPSRILLISGGMAGMINEILKYNVSEITYLEINPGIFRFKKYLSSLKNYQNKINVIKEDIRTYLTRNRDIYDVIILNLPPPSTIGLNRFYTVDFYNVIRNHCDENSVVCTSLPSTLNYAGKESLTENAILWKTLGVKFKHRLLITGGKNYFLSSQSSLNPKITQMIKQRDIKTQYVNEYYMDDDLMISRSNILVSGFPSEAKVNHDFSPSLFLAEINTWLSHFGIVYYFLISLPLLFFIFGIFRQNGISVGLYTGGFSSASLEIVLLLIYQIIFGSIYSSISLFFAVFMGGLVLGSLWKCKKDYFMKRYVRLQFLLAIYAVFLPLLIIWTDHISGHGVLLRLLFLILILIPSFITGNEFYLSSGMRKKSYRELSGKSYSTDLFGSAIGSFLTSIALIPLLGLIWTCFILAILNIFSGLWGLLFFRHMKNSLFL